MKSYATVSSLYTIHPSCNFISQTGHCVPSPLVILSTPCTRFTHKSRHIWKPSI